MKNDLSKFDSGSTSKLFPASEANFNGCQTLNLLPSCTDFKQYMSSPTVSSCFDENDTQKDQMLSRSVSTDNANLHNVTDDKHQQLVFLTDFMDEKEDELCQAAAYGLDLLQRNEELQVQMASLKIQHETEMHDIIGSQERLHRRYEDAVEERKQWKARYCQAQEELDFVEEKLGQISAVCEANHMKRERHNLLMQEARGRIQELEAQLLRIERQETPIQDADIHSSVRRESLVQEQYSQVMLQRLQDENARLRLANAKLFSAKTSLEMSHAIHDNMCKKLKDANEALRAEVDELRSQNEDRMQAFQSVTSKCIRLEREIGLLDHISSMSLEILHADFRESGVTMENMLREKRSSCETEESCLTPREEKFTTSQMRSASQQKAQAIAPSISPVKDHHDDRSSGARVNSVLYNLLNSSAASEAKNPIGDIKINAQMLATHEKLYHYFHLTAQSIIHEGASHDKLFLSSSRFAIDQWYREVVTKDISFLLWHSWLSKRIAHLRAAFQDSTVSKCQVKSKSFGFLRRFHWRSSPQTLKDTSSTVQNRRPVSLPSCHPTLVSKAIRTQSQSAAMSFLQKRLPQRKKESSTKRLQSKKKAGTKPTELSSI